MWCVQAVTLACKKGHSEEAQAAVASLQQQCMVRKQHKKEVLPCGKLAVTASAGSSGEHTLVSAGDGGGLLSNHLQSKKHKALDKEVSAAHLHQQAAGSVEQHAPQATNGSSKGILQHALQSESNQWWREKADADRAKHKEGSHDLSRPSSHDSARELHRQPHHKECRHDKSSQRHDRAAHRHYNNSSVRHTKLREHSLSEHQNRHSANLSSHANGHRPSSSSLPSSRVEGKDVKRHQHSPDLGRPRSGSHHRIRSRSPHERNHDRWVYQKR